MLTLANNHRPIQHNGFTLVELIIVIVLIGIISTVVTPLISGKFTAVSQTADRSKWVQQAEYAVTMLRRDLANSVPNSVCTDNTVDCGLTNQAVEFLAAPPNAPVNAARYRNRQYSSYDRLRRNNDVSFDVFTQIDNLTDYYSYLSIGTTNVADMRDDWQTNLVSNNGTLAEIDSFTSSATGGENSSPLTNITLTATHSFPRNSPYFRVYFFSGPVAYYCDTTAGFLYRVSDYTNLSSTAFATRIATAQEDRVISNVQSCEFEWNAGMVYNPPSLRVTLQIGEGSESIQLIDTIILSNAS